MKPDSTQTIMDKYQHCQLAFVARLMSSEKINKWINMYDILYIQ